jgi:hypothetical protein
VRTHLAIGAGARLLVGPAVLGNGYALALAAAESQVRTGLHAGGGSQERTRENTGKFINFGLKHPNFPSKAPLGSIPYRQNSLRERNRELIVP